MPGFRWSMGAVFASEGHAAAPAGASIAYIGNAGSNDISVFRLEAGGMVPVQTATFPEAPAAGSSTPLAVSPDGRFLYAGLRGAPFQVAAFAIDPSSGRLSPLGNAPLADSMAHLATDRSGRFLFSASYGGNKVAVNPIGPDGRAQPPSQILPTGRNAHAILPDPANRHVFATNLGDDQVLGFRFDAESGQLAPMPSPALRLPTGAGPRHFIFHPNGRVIYLLGELDASLQVIAYDAEDGSWQPIARASALPPDFAGKPWAAELHVTPDGRFLYASERRSSTLAGFRLEEDGRLLHPLGSVPTEAQPRGFAIDPEGRYLAAVGEASHAMTLHAIDPQSGALRVVGQYPTGRQPNWVTFLRLP
jgi:6-phosphogluconolactonase